MTPDRIRELCTRSENPDLDFKKTQYDWDRDGNLELAKDIMAMANVLHAAAEPAHILIGVEALPDNTGRIVGVPIEVLLDDALMHQKIERLLNATPAFKHHIVQVDGAWLGVIEIRPGGRPFFPIGDKGGEHRIRRNVAYYRPGTNTAEASPSQVVEWAQVDGRIDAEATRLNLDYLRAQVEPAPNLWGNGVSSGGGRVSLTCGIENVGLPTFVVEGASATMRFPPDVRELFAAPECADDSRRMALADRAVNVEVNGRTFAPGEKANVVAQIDLSEPAFVRFQNEVRKRASELGVVTKFRVEVEVSVTCRAATRRTATAKRTLTWQAD